MLTRRNANVLLAAAATSVLLYGGTAHANPTPAPVAVEVLTPRAAFTDVATLQLSLKDGHGTSVIKASDPSHIVTTKATVQPGAQIPWHTHAGPVFVTIAEGEMTYVSSEGCVSRRYPVGTAFIDPGHGHVHTAYNSGKALTVFFATFFEAPSGTAPLSIPADAPADCTIPTSR
jgi:quercetin dioxygenase-like cupin family protein